MKLVPVHVLGCALSLALLGVRIPGVRFRNTKLKISRRLIYSNYNMECTPTSKYRCELCNKSYSSRQNLWKHNTKFHKTETLANTSETSKITSSLPQNTSTSLQNSCKYCNKIYSRKDNLNRHMKTCKSKNIVSIKLKEKDEQIQELKSMVTNLLKSCKIHPKTLQKINNQINNNNNNTNNGTINNNVIMKFGNVNINEVLSNKQIMSILHKPFVSVEECVKMIHFNDKLPQYNNIYITNMKDDLVYVYDGTKFTTTTKSDAINDLIDNYSDQIEISFDDNKDKMTEYKIKCVENYLELINSNTEYIDQHNKKYTNFKTYKVGDVKRLIYDKSDPKKFAMVCKGIDV